MDTSRLLLATIKTKTIKNNKNKILFKLCKIPVYLALKYSYSSSSSKRKLKTMLNNDQSPGASARIPLRANFDNFNRLRLRNIIHNNSATQFIVFA